MPGKVATLTISWLSYTMCSYTSSLIIKTSCSQQRLQIPEISSAEKTFPSGLFGLLKMMALVLDVKTFFSSSTSSFQSPEETKNVFTSKTKAIIFNN